MKYEGPNREGFERDVRLFLEWRNEWPNGTQRTLQKIHEAAHDLADAYGIGHAEIWDIIPEYEDED